MCSSSPDLSGINNAAEASSNIAQQALTWYTNEEARTQGQRDESTNVQNQVAQAQLAGDQQQTSAAADTQNFLNNSVRPVEQQVITNAQNYDTPEREQAAADSATADVRAAQAGAQTTQAQSLARMGYDPTTNSTKLAANDALQVAGAATAARQKTQATGTAMLDDAANMGQGIASNQVAQMNSGTSAGSTASGAASSAYTTAASGASMMQAGYGLGLQGEGQAGSLYNDSATQQNTANAQQSSMISGIAGAAMLASDENIKTDTGKPLDGETAIAQIKAIPVHAGWKYDPAKGGPDDGGVPHDGPMAQDVQAVMGNHVAPGGKKIDVVSMLGKQHAAIATMAKKIDRLQKAVA